MLSVYLNSQEGVLPPFFREESTALGGKVTGKS